MKRFLAAIVFGVMFVPGVAFTAQNQSQFEIHFGGISNLMVEGYEYSGGFTVHRSAFNNLFYIDQVAKDMAGTATITLGIDNNHYSTFIIDENPATHNLQILSHNDHGIICDGMSRLNSSRVYRIKFQN